MSESYSFCADSVSYGFGPLLVNPSSPAIFDHTKFGKFRVVTHATKASASAFDYAIRAAQFVFAKSESKVVNLALSSGVDSQAMLQTFLAAKIPVRAVHFRYNETLNDFDTEYIQGYCRDLQMEVKVIDVDLFDFFVSRKKHLEYHSKYRIHIPGIAVHLWCADQLQEPVIFAGNPPSVSSIHGRPCVDMPSDAFFSYERYFDLNRKFGTGNFFISTREMISAFIQTPTIQKHLRDKDLVFSYEAKIATYREAGFMVTPQPGKYHGFEKFDEAFQKKFSEGFHDRTFREILKIDPTAIDEDVSYDSPYQVTTELEYFR